MTMMHLMNCVLLTYGPFVVTYRSSKLADYSPFQSCFMSGLIFAATALCKILFMAVFLPASAEESHGFSWAQESGKLIANVVCEVAGVSMALRNAPGLSKFPAVLRVLAVTIGWAFAEAVAQYALPLVIGARGNEFSWEYLEMGILANISIPYHFALIAAVWLYRRDPALKQTAFAIGAAHFALPTLCRFAQSTGYSMWASLGARLVVSVSLALFSARLLNRTEKTKAA